MFKSYVGPCVIHAIKCNGVIRESWNLRSIVFRFLRTVHRSDVLLKYACASMYDCAWLKLNDLKD